MNEETIETMPDDVQEFLTAANNADATPEYSLLKVWREVLSNIEQAMETRLSMAAVNNIVRAWPQIKVQEAGAYHWSYHSSLLMMRNILDEVIDSDEDAIDREGDEDIELNRKHYFTLLTEWQRQLVRWERNWDANAKDAHIWMAVFLTVGEFFFGDQGLVRHLDLRGFELSDEDAAGIWNEAQEV